MIKDGTVIVSVQALGSSARSYIGNDSNHDLDFITNKNYEYRVNFYSRLREMEFLSVFLVTSISSKFNNRKNRLSNIEILRKGSRNIHRKNYLLKQYCS